MIISANPGFYFHELYFDDASDPNYPDDRPDVELLQPGDVSHTVYPVIAWRIKKGYLPVPILAADNGGDKVYDAGEEREWFLEYPNGTFYLDGWVFRDFASVVAWCRKRRAQYAATKAEIEAEARAKDT